MESDTSSTIIPPTQPSEHIVDDLDWAWADNLHDEYEDINENATYFKAPYATLYFDYDDV